MIMANSRIWRPGWVMGPFILAAVAWTLLWPAGSAPGAAGAAMDAPEKLPHVDRFGPETTSYLYRMSWEALKERLQGTAALKAIEDPEVQAFFNEIQRVGTRDELVADTFAFCLSALHEELTIAGSTEDPGGAAGADPAASAPAPALNPDEELPERGWHAAIAQASPASRARLGQAYSAMLKAAPECIGEVSPTQVENTTFQVLGQGLSCVYTLWQDDRAYWILGGQKAARRLLKPGEPSLGRSEMFRAATAPLLAGMTDQPAALYYYDLRPGWKRLTSTPEAAQVWDGLSWRCLDAVSGATFVQDGLYRNRHYWKVGGQRTGLFRHSQASRIDPEWLKRVPADASGFTTGVWDPHSLVLGLIGLSGKLGGTSNEDLTGAAAMTMPVISLLRDVGPRYLVYRMPGRYGQFPLSNAIPLSDLVVVSQLGDAKTFQANLDELLEKGPFMRGTVTAAGQEVKVINVMYLSLYLAIRENLVLLTINPQLLKDALENWDHPGPSIVDTPAYQAASKHILPDACFLMYIQPGGFCRGIYDQYIPMLQQAIALPQGMGDMWGGNREETPAAARGFNPFLLPRGAALARHATTPTIISARDDGQGVLFDGRAPVLCTPYYCAYVHALARLRPPSDKSFFDVLSWFVLPLGQQAD